MSPQRTGLRASAVWIPRTPATTGKNERIEDMTKIWKPTARECELIKQAAARESHCSVARVLLEPGIKTGPKWEQASEIKRGDYNIALVTDDPNWNDTDLYEYGSWADFRKGVALTEDGRAIIDFYIRWRFDEEQELRGNVEVYYADGRLAEIRGYPSRYPIE